MDLELVPLDSETRIDGPAEFKPKTRQAKYTGIERRLRQRRIYADRRTMHRFEPDKNDRRSRTDRRDTGAKWDKL